MTVPSADKTRMETRPQWQRVYLAVDHPATIWTGQVDGAHDQGDTTISPKNGAFAGGYFPSDVEEHFTLWVGTAAGTQDVAVVRFRSCANLTSGSDDIKVATNAIAWADNHYLTLKQEIRPWAVLPSLDGIYEDEDKTYSDENTNQHPLGRIGPPAAGYLNAAGKFDVYFQSDSVAVASGASLTANAWTFTNGTPASSAVADPGWVEYSSAGQHWVKYTVTDDNGKSHNRFTKVYVFSDASPAYTDITIDSLSGDRDSGGWRMSVTVHEACDTSRFPDMARVVLFAEEHWGTDTAEVGYGWTGRAHVLFVGYIVGDTVYQHPETDGVSFEIIGISELMKRITCWGATFRKTTSDNCSPWHIISGMSTNGLNLPAFHVITEHTTIDHIADVYLSLDTIDMCFIDLHEGAVFDHLKVQIGEAGRAILGSNKWGQIYLEPLLLQCLTTYKAGVDIVIDLDKTDWRGQIDIGPEKHTKDVAQIDFIGFSYATDCDIDPWGSLAPGRQWSTGTIKKITGVRVSGQAEANQYASVFEKHANNEYTDVQVPMAGFWPVFDIFPQGYVRISLTSTDNSRGLSWTTISHAVKGVSHAHHSDGGYILTDLTLEQDFTYGTGTSNPFPDEPDPDDTDPIDPAPPVTPCPPEAPAILSTPEVAILWNYKQVFRSINFDDAVPTWTLEIGGLEDNPGDDYINSGNRQIQMLDIDITSGYAWCVNTDGIWKCDMLTSGNNWTLVKTTASCASDMGRTDVTPTLNAIRCRGNIILVVDSNHSGNRSCGWVISTNGGTTWTGGRLGPEAASNVIGPVSTTCTCNPLGTQTFYHKVRCSIDTPGVNQVSRMYNSQHPYAIAPDLYYYVGRAWDDFPLIPPWIQVGAGSFYHAWVQICGGPWMAGGPGCADGSPLLLGEPTQYRGAFKAEVGEVDICDSWIPGSPDYARAIELQTSPTGHSVVMYVTAGGWHPNHYFLLRNYDYTLQATGGFPATNDYIEGTGPNGYGGSAYAGRTISGSERLIDLAGTVVLEPETYFVLDDALGWPEVYPRGTGQQIGMASDYNTNPWDQKAYLIWTENGGTTWVDKSSQIWETVVNGGQYRHWVTTGDRRGVCFFQYDLGFS